MVSLIELICPAINILIDSIQIAESKRIPANIHFVSGESYYRFYPLEKAKFTLVNIFSMSPSFCELCGRSITDGKRSIMIDNTVLNVCMGCSRRGKPYVPPARGLRKQNSSSSSSRDKPRRIQLTDDTMLNPEFAKIIREARMKLGLSHEQLGIRMNERAILLRKLETGALKPDEGFAKKLERYLGIRLYKSLKEDE
jgi:putative transcription factor